MINWYPLIEEQSFIDSGLTSFEATLILQDIGEAKVLVTRGNKTGIVFDDTFLVVGMNDRNPFRYGDKAVFKDEDGLLWLGIYTDDL